jgi:alkylated DNA repair dioxygenase AlkB
VRPRQLDLFAHGTGAPAFDPAFARARRHELADGAWVEHVPGWVTNHDALFDQLERGLGWRNETMWMYERMVEVPRLLARVHADGAGQPLIESMRHALSARYGEDFVRTTAALYRDGKDSVAFHGDTTARDMDQALVATVSLGEPRKFVMRPTAGGGETRTFAAGGGDLIVMGGTAQRTWRHGVPKVASAGPRIALMFRPAWGAAYDDD